jgi:hypothetical protein
VAQLHLAFIKFHNKIVESLENPNDAPEVTRSRAREKVVNCFHSIILNDFLPSLLDEPTLQRVKDSKADVFAARTANDVFMPLEFSAAAFRFGHSMVRSSYQWNGYHSDEISVPARLGQLLDQTEFSGSIGKDGGNKAIDSDWIIDWRRFFDFSSLGYPKTDTNRAGKIDRVFNLHLEKLTSFPHNGLSLDVQPIMVRNLLRGLALDLPSGEEVANAIRQGSALKPDQLAADSESEIKELLDSPLLKGRTPLYYYILREAELNGGEKLGEVGSYIVAQTLIGLMQASKNSAFDSNSQEKFRMIDLLHQADVVDPIGRHLDSLYAPQVLHASHP